MGLFALCTQTGLEPGRPQRKERGQKRTLISTKEAEHVGKRKTSAQRPDIKQTGAGRRAVGHNVPGTDDGREGGGGKQRRPFEQRPGMSKYCNDREKGYQLARQNGVIPASGRREENEKRE